MVLVAPLLLAGVCLADEPASIRLTSSASNTDALTTRMEALEGEVTALQAAWQKEPVKGSCCDTSCGTSCIAVGADLAILSPHLGSINLGGSLLGYVHPVPLQVTPDFDYYASPRVWVASQNCEGLGLRAAYWQFDNATSLQIPHPLDLGGLGLGDFDLDVSIYDPSISVGLEAHTMDLEVTQRTSFCSMGVQIAGGVRYAKMRTDLAFSGEVEFGTDYLTQREDGLPIKAGVFAEFEGMGPTIALDVVRPVGCRGFALVGGLRGAWLYGVTDAGTSADLQELADIDLKVDGHMMQIWAAQIGAQWSSCMANGGQLVAKVVWEAQAWEWAPVLSLLHQDVGFTGPTVSVAVVR
jgi:hypothetical protein